MTVEGDMERVSHYRRSLVLALLLTGLLSLLGCYNTPIDVSDYRRGPAPLRMPAIGPDEKCCYEDSLRGGHVFEMYCAACHNARSLAERPFSNYQNVAAHMRVRANLTGKEYAELLAFMRRWADIPNPPQSDEPSPKRFIYSQPISELRDQKTKEGPDLPSGPRPGGMAEGSPGQPPPGNSPREAR
jgi:hypothetical protein